MGGRAKSKDERAKMKSERREFKEFKEFREFREISENQLDCSVIFGFSGLEATLEESTNEIENRACQVYLNKALFSILFVVTAK